MTHSSCVILCIISTVVLDKVLAMHGDNRRNIPERQNTKHTIFVYKQWTNNGVLVCIHFLDLSYGKIKRLLIFTQSTSITYSFHVSCVCFLSCPNSQIVSRKVYYNVAMSTGSQLWQNKTGGRWKNLYLTVS